MITLTSAQVFNSVKETTPSTAKFGARHFTYAVEGVTLKVVLSPSCGGFLYDNHALKTGSNFTVKDSYQVAKDCLFARKTTNTPFPHACLIIRHLLNSRKY